jgi:hypothetical protein
VRPLVRCLASINLALTITCVAFTFPVLKYSFPLDVKITNIDHFYYHLLDTCLFLFSLLKIPTSTLAIMSRMPFGGMGLPGANPRAPPREKQYPDSPGAPSYGRADPYGANQSNPGYRDRDPRIAPQGRGSGGYDAGRSPGMPRQSDMGSSGRGSARQVPLRVEKVQDKSLSDRLIFSNL